MDEKPENLRIDDGIYGFELRQHIYKCRLGNTHKKLFSLISKLLKVKLTDATKESIRNEFNDEDLSMLKAVDLISQVNNKEVLARWFDVLLTLDNKSLGKVIKFARTNYADVYHATSDYMYLIRSLALVKYAKNIFQEEINAIFEEARVAIIKSDAPYLQQKVLIELVSISGHNKCNQIYYTVLNEQILEFCQRTEFRSARFGIKSLNIIKSIDLNECRIRLGENYELEGDHHVSQKESNTYYPTISKTYLKGLRIIESAKECGELRKRLVKKVAQEQALDFEMIQRVGVNTSPPINMEEIRNIVLDLHIDSFASAYHQLLGLPIIPQSAIDMHASKAMKSSDFFTTAFPTHVKINDKGAEIAMQNSQEAHANSFRTFSRERILALIHIIKGKMDVFGEVSTPFVEHLLLETKSPFIPESRIHLYVIGITEGFNNNFISSAHILTPQIESSLRYMADQNSINVTMLEKELQFENLLGGCLEKIRPLANPDIIGELKSFLIDGNSINFRNNLLHGLMDPIFIQKYGMYLWWLSLKLITQTKELFPNANNTSNV